jgi:hypothetical protein
LKTKILALIAITTIALLTTSYAFACLTTSPQIDFDSPNIEYTTAQTTDNENTNTANIQAQITHDHNTINVQITNAYPNYQAQVIYTIKNTGNYPVQFSEQTIINPNPEAIQIITTNHQNTILQPSQTTQGTTTIRTLPSAQEKHQYAFQITNIASTTPPETDHHETSHHETSHPEPCHPQTTTFWADQYKLWLNGKCNQAKVDASTLEQYLNQISAQSKIFKFTGSQTQKFQQALYLLTPSYSADSETKLQTQLLAVWLNQMADWTTNFKIDDKAANSIIQSTETVLLKHRTNQYQTWRLICELFNNLD